MPGGCLLQLGSRRRRCPSTSSSCSACSQVLEQTSMQAQFWAARKQRVGFARNPRAPGRVSRGQERNAGKAALHYLPAAGPQEGFVPVRPSSSHSPQACICKDGCRAFCPCSGFFWGPGFRNWLSRPTFQVKKQVPFQPSKQPAKGLGSDPPQPQRCFARVGGRIMLQ